MLFRSTISSVSVYNVDLRPQQVPDFFRSGMNANVDFITQRKENVLLLPVLAVNKKEDQSFVWLAGPNKSKPIMREVQTGITDDKKIEIISGLKEEDEVIMKTKKYSMNKVKNGSNPFMASRPPGGGR